MDAIEALIENAAMTEFESLPAQTVERARMAILDTLGVLVAGSSAEGIGPLLEQARAWGGAPEATVLVFGDRLPAPLAALVNASMARALDFDDCEEQTGDHPSVAAVPAALIAAELGSGISGRDLLVAVAVAVDVVMRIRRATPLRTGPRMPWTTGTFAPLTATFAAARAMRLDRETFTHAVGIAFTTLSNTLQSHLDGALAHRVHQGLAAQSAFSAIALARRGISGVRHVLEGPFGFYRAYHHGEYDRERLLADLGRRYLIDEVSIKPFPCCKMTHGAAEGIIRLVQQHALAASDVREARVRVNQGSYMLCGRQPWRHPENVVEAQFNIPYVAAAALARGRVGLAEFSAEALADPLIRETAMRVQPEVDPALDALGLQIAPTEVELRLVDGSLLRSRVEHVPGHPANPLDFEAIVEKFHDCAPYAALPLPAGAAEQAVAMVRNLEQLDDVTALLQALSRTT